MDWISVLSSALAAAVGIEAVVYCLAAIGLNVHFGYTGLLNFGQAGFLAVAAYGMSMIVATFGLPLWLGLIVGLSAAVVLALLLGAPTLRLRADYLAIVTIAAAEIIRLLFRSVTLSEWTGGSDGMQAFASDFYSLPINPFDAQKTYSFVPIPIEGEFGPFTFSGRVTWVLVVGWLVVILCTILVLLLMRSPWGRVLKAIREDEDAARSLGKNVFSYKMQALILGGVLGSLGGFIFALGRAAVQPDLFHTELTFFVYTVLILGGAARVFAPIVGAAIFWCLLVFTDVALREAIRADYWFPAAFMDENQIGQVRFMLVGLGLVLLLIFRPQGIFGDKRELALDARR